MQVKQCNVQTKSAQRGKYALFALSTPPQSLMSLLSPCSFLLLNLKGPHTTRVKHHHKTTVIAQPIHLLTLLITESYLFESYLIKSLTSMLACYGGQPSILTILHCDTPPFRTPQLRHTTVPTLPPKHRCSEIKHRYLWC